MTAYIYVWFLLFTLSFCDFFRINKKLQLILLTIAFVILSVFIGLRWETGNDWFPYIEYYSNLVSLDDHSESFEIGFRSISYLMKSIGLNYSLNLLLITSFYLFIFIYLIFQHTTAPLLLVLIFYCTYLLGWMGTSRQIIAISLVMLSFEFYYKERKWITYSLILIASTFHISAVLVYLTLPFLKLNLTLKKIISLLIILFLFGIAANGVMEVVLSYIGSSQDIWMRMQGYVDQSISDLNTNSGDNILIFWYLKRIMYLAIFLYFYDSLNEGKLRFYFNLYLLSIFIFFIFINIIPMIALRLSGYFSFYELFLFAGMLRRNLSAKNIIWFLFVILLSFQRMYTSFMIYHPEDNLPYKSIFINQEVLRGRE